MFKSIGIDRFSLFIFALSSLFIFLGVYNHNVVYVSLLINILLVVKGDFKQIFSQLFFLIPFAMVYKSDPSSSSFFTYLMIFSAAALIFQRRLNLIMLTPIAVYLLVGGLSSLLIWIKILTGFILLVSFVQLTDKDTVKSVILSFTLGLIVSSIIGLFKMDIPQLASYFSDFNEEYIGGIKMARFSALYLDPNFYSISVVMAVFLLMNLSIRKMLPILLSSPLIIILIYFGLLSYSKMFVLAIILVLITQLWGIVNKSRYKVWGILFAIAVFCALAYSFITSAYYEGFSSRLDTDDLSNNRLLIWGWYFSYLLGSPTNLLLGSGLDAPLVNNVEPHNTYIEALYYLGIVGSIIYYLTIRCIFNHRKLVFSVSHKNKMLLYVFCVMICTLHVLLIHDLMFYMILLWISFNLPYYENTSNSY